MTHQPDDRQPEDPATGPSEEPALTDDDVWASIVANYGERPDLSPAGREEPLGGPDPLAEPPPQLPEPGAPAHPKRNVFDRAFLDSQRLESPSGELNTAGSWDDEGHFVPPPPPPLPVLEPRRKVAWIGLFGAPLLMLFAVIFGWVYPPFIMALLVAAFVGGFIYLVATMPRIRGGGPGDDGAVV